MTSDIKSVDLVIGVSKNKSLNNQIQLTSIGEQWLNNNNNNSLPSSITRGFHHLNQCKMMHNVMDDDLNGLLSNHAIEYLKNKNYQLNRIVFVCYAIDAITDDEQDENDRNDYIRQQYSSLSSNNDNHNNDNNDIGNARNAVNHAIQSLIKDSSEKETQHVLVDTSMMTHMDHVESYGQMIQQVSEGVHLMNYHFYLPKQEQQEQQQEQAQEQEEEKNAKTMQFEPLYASSSQSSVLNTHWKRGMIFAHNQNYARFLQELPANYCTPHLFCQMVLSDVMNDNQNLLFSQETTTTTTDRAVSGATVMIHDRQWAESHNMNSFLSVSNGSVEPPFVLECQFMNNKKNGENDTIDLILVGKGVTFDAGGLSLKPGAGMKLMKSDMGGAATVVAVFRAIVQLQLPINVIAVCMMVENMIDSRATRPGDVITASNGKTIEVDNTDAEGRLALADGLVYASKRSPRYLVDMATLTGAIGIALSDAATGCFTTTNHMWNLFERASIQCDDLFWRMPLFRAAYKKQLKALSADLNNVGGRAGGACTAAAFLAEFVDFDKVQHFAHLDIAEVVIPEATGECGTGRSTRTVISFVESLVQQSK